MINVGFCLIKYVPEHELKRADGYHPGWPSIPRDDSGGAE